MYTHIQTLCKKFALLFKEQALNSLILKILCLHDLTVALNYGVFRRKMFNSTTQYYMFYDAGATSTSATLVGQYLMKQRYIVQYSREIVLCFSYTRQNPHVKNVP